MSEKAPTRDLQRWTYEQGNRLAHEAETGKTDNVNRELTQVRGQLTPREYNALISSIRSANTAHVAQEQYDLAGKHVKSLSIPTLIFGDSPKDKDKFPDHIAGRILADGKKETVEEPKSEKALQAERAAKIDQRMKETGNYGPAWGGDDDAAFRHVLNLKRN